MVRCQSTWYPLIDRIRRVCEEYMMATAGFCEGDAEDLLHAEMSSTCGLPVVK